MTIPWNAIFNDLDGSLTDKGPDTWATHYYPHLVNENCEKIESLGVACDSSVKMRRIAFDAVPSGLFGGMGMKILRYDDDYIAA